jgi:hypothetical protein
MKKLLSLIILFFSLSAFGYAFDTGPHFDLTSAVLNERGFGETAIKLAQVENWLTDYYSATPTSRGGARDDLEKLHFDNLFSTEETVRYWSWFLNNLHDATRQAAKDNDQLAMLTTLSMALHATQDFYSHSNWVETHPRSPNGAYRTETFLAIGLAGLPQGVQLVTGKYPEDRKGAPAAAAIHGNYETGLNKDSPVRPHWDEAYVFAYCASHELVELLEQWSEEANPGFWKRVQQFGVAPADQQSLAYDLRAVRNMSMWINAKDEDGHWKGNYSGVHRFFDVFSSKWIGKANSMFVKQIADRKLQKRLVNHLYSDGSLSALPALPLFPKARRFSLRRRAVLVRTTLIKEKGDEGRLEIGIDPGGKPDFYAVIKIGQQEYGDRVLQNQKEFSNPWFEIHFVDANAATVPIIITVWDEDDLDPGGDYKDNHIDINPVAKKRDLELVVRLSDDQLSGDITGVHNSVSTAFTVGGAKPDNKRAVITAYVASYPLAGRGSK